MDKETSEIDKLTERIAKDPKSKLFVPLAEEYKKAGDLEMSILVLTEGLKNNPGYVTARSFLGRLLIERGDLAGAQKEFEEVVKAIPDNLMAQRKLGDLYALQDRSADALARYKIVLSLNPGDQETASLASEIETGRDIKARLSRQKPQAVEETRKKQFAPAPAGPSPRQPEPAPPAAAAAAPAPAAVVEEVAEDVPVVEPLEPAVPAGLAQELSFLAEPGREAGDAAEAEKGDALFTLNEPFAAEQSAGEVVAGEEPLFGPEEPGPEKAAEETKQADDFTTDTLAELYITQGFFEKAIDIYERMVVDNPNSQGLKNKLAKVRAMAAEAAPVEGTNIEPRHEAGPEAVKKEETPSAGLMQSLDEYVPPAQEGEQPLPDEAWSQPVPAPETGEKKEPAAAPPRPPKMFDVGFEPVEYVPPDAVPKQRAAPAEPGEAADASARKAAPARRKETIDRLEKWLHAIKKEK